MFQIYLGPFPFHVGLHRISGIDLIAFNIAGYPRLSCKNSVITDGDMARASYLSGKDAVIACFRTAGNPYLGDNEAIFPDFHIMAEMNEIIDFCSPFDNGTVQCPIVDAGAGPDFHVVPDFYIANLGNPRMTAFIGSKTKAFAADDRMGPDDKAVAKLAVLMDDGTGINDGVIADGNIIANENIGINDAVFPYSDISANDRIGHDSRIIPQDSAVIDNSRRMNTPGHGLTGMEEYQEL